MTTLFEIGRTRGPSGSYVSRIEEQENVLHKGPRDSTEGQSSERAGHQRQEHGEGGKVLLHCILPLTIGYLPQLL